MCVRISHFGYRVVQCMQEDNCTGLVQCTSLHSDTLDCRQLWGREILASQTMHDTSQQTHVRTKIRILGLHSRSHGSPLYPLSHTHSPVTGLQAPFTQGAQVMLQPLPNVPFGQASRDGERRRGGKEGERRDAREGGREGGRERRLGTCYTKSSLTFDICNTVTFHQVP